MNLNDTLVLNAGGLGSGRHAGSFDHMHSRLSSLGYKKDVAIGKLQGYKNKKTGDFASVHPSGSWTHDPAHAPATGGVGQSSFDNHFGTD
jgi:hypothetical protein